MIIERETGRALSVCNKGASHIAIPTGVKKIDERAFAFCDQISEIELTPDLREIGVCAFQGCKRLRILVIPQNILRIGYGAFSSCENLDAIYCEASSKPIGWHAEWNEGCAATVYWGNEWKYIPTPIVKK